MVTNRPGALIYDENGHCPDELPNCTGLYGTEMETLSTQVCVATADE